MVLVKQGKETNKAPMLYRPRCIVRQIKISCMQERIEIGLRGRVKLSSR